MIGTTLQARIFVCTQDTDMRKSFNALFSIIKSAMHLDPLTGYLFVFKNKRADRIKVVYWEGDGFAMWYKVLQKGTFQFPDLANFSSAGIEIDPSTLSLILQGIDLASIRRRNRYKQPEQFLENQPSHADTVSPLQCLKKVWKERNQALGADLICRAPNLNQHLLYRVIVFTLTTANFWVLGLLRIFIQQCDRMFTPVICYLYEFIQNLVFLLFVRPSISRTKFIQQLAPRLKTHSCPHQSPFRLLVRRVRFLIRQELLSWFDF